MQINYGIMAIRPAEEEGMVDIVHFCGYEEPIREIDVDLLREELSTDPEFELVGQMEDVELVEAPPEIVALYRDMFNTDPNWHEAN